MFIEIPANNLSLAMRRPVFGVGINDADYITQTNVSGSVEICPYYTKWSGMIKRCYSKKYKEKYPTYIGCSVIGEWLIFSNFKVWMKKQDWKNKELDKDILVQGNKIYSPEFCAFVSQAVNSLFVGRQPTDKEKGVSFHKKTQTFNSRISINGKKVSLGYFGTEAEAGTAYVKAKYKNIVRVANEQTDKRIRNALLRYKIPNTNIQLLGVTS